MLLLRTRPIIYSCCLDALEASGCPRLQSPHDPKARRPEDPGHQKGLKEVRNRNRECSVILVSRHPPTSNEHPVREPTRRSDERDTRRSLPEGVGAGAKTGPCLASWCCRTVIMRRRRNKDRNSGNRRFIVGSSCSLLTSNTRIFLHSSLWGFRLYSFLRVYAVS